MAEQRRKGITCLPCGKTGYERRKEARGVAKSVHPGEHLSAYECKAGLWHYGHLPAQVADGRWARADLGQAMKRENPYFNRPAA